MTSIGKNSVKEIVENPFLMDEWLDAIEELKKTDPRIYEEIEEYADREWASYIADELEVADEPLDLINNYLNLLSDKEIIDGNDFKSGKRGDKIIIDISGKYSKLIKRGGFFSYLIQLATQKIYNHEEKITGNTCKIELSPGVFTLRVGLSYRIGRGSVNVSGKDLSKLGMDMIENVTLVPVGKENGIAEMMSSSSKVSSGFVIMNIEDANLIGVKEGSKVELIKKEEEEEAEKEDAIEEAGEKGDETGEKAEAEKEEIGQQKKEQDPGEAKDETKGGEKTVEKEKPKIQETQTPKPKPAKSDNPKETLKPESQPKIQKQKQAIKEVKKQNIPKKQTTQDKTKQMKDFESKIDALRSQ